MVIGREGVAVSGPSAAAVAARRRTAASLATATLGLVVLTACQDTSISGLNVRARPTTQSAVVATLGRTGTKVEIACKVTGQAIHGEATWYRITSPARGYVTHYYVNSPGSVRSC